MNVIGPHNSFSFLDGEIQFKIVTNRCIAIAPYAVQSAQLGTSSPYADVMLPYRLLLEWTTRLLFGQILEEIRHSVHLG